MNFIRRVYKMPRFFRAAYNDKWNPYGIVRTLRIAWRATNCTIFYFNAYDHPLVAKDTRSFVVGPDYYMAICVTPKEDKALPWCIKEEPIREDARR